MEYLQEPRLEKLEDLLAQHSKKIVRYQEQLVSVESIVWLPTLDQESQKNFIQSTQRKIKKLQDLNDRGQQLAQERSFAAQLNQDQNLKAKAAIFFLESFPIKLESIPQPFVPGARVFSRTVPPTAQVASAGPWPVILTSKNLTLLDLSTGKTRKNLERPFGPLKIKTTPQGAWLLGTQGFGLIDRDQKFTWIRTKATPAGWPLRGPDCVFVPLMQGDSPCEFVMSRWSWPDGQLLNKHFLFARNDRKGRLRNVPWLPGPLNQENFYYLTHCGAVLKADSADGRARELILYPSLKVETILENQLQDPPKTTFQKHQQDLWFLQPQDSDNTWLLDTQKNQLTRTSLPTPQIGPRVSLEKKGFLDAKGRILNFLPGETGTGQWIPQGGNWLWQQDNQLRSIAPLNRSPDDHPDVASREGSPLPGTPDFLLKIIDDVLVGKRTIENNQWPQIIRSPPTSIRKLLPKLWPLLSLEQQVVCWNHWLEIRPFEPFPIQDLWQIPKVFLEAVLFGPNPPTSLKQTLPQFPSQDPQSLEVQNPQRPGPWVSGPPLELDGWKIVWVDSQSISFQTAQGPREYFYPQWFTLSERSESKGSLRVNSSDKSISTWEPIESTTSDRAPKIWSNISSSEFLRGDQAFGVTAWLTKTRNLARLKIKDREGRFWGAPILLSQRAWVACLPKHVLLVDSAQGQGWFLSETGEIQSQFNLLDRGPFTLYRNPKKLLLVSEYVVHPFHCPNRFQELKKAWPKQKSGWPLEFAYYWNQFPRRSQIEAVNSPELRSRLLTGWQRQQNLTNTVSFKSSQTSLPLRFDGLLDDPYEEENRLSLEGLPGSRVYAANNLEGLMIAVCVPDSTWREVVSQDGVRRGDKLIVAWDPFNDARWGPESDDNLFIFGPRDPNNPRDIEIVPQREGGKPFGGRGAIQHINNFNIFELFIPWKDVGHRLPIRLNIAYEDDDGQTMKLYRLAPGIEKNDFIPRLMPLLDKK